MKIFAIQVSELRTQAEIVYTKYEKRFNNFQQLAKVEIERLRKQLDALLKEVIDSIHFYFYSFNLIFYFLIQYITL